MREFRKYLGDRSINLGVNMISNFNSLYTTDKAMFSANISISIN